ncbi:MAG TPA: SPASM domain-containing protein [Myxococcota bacterium]|nr:SPASM domain-containing protein [Myxococcota bacterium]
MRPPCAGLWATPMVHVTGDVTVCCLDEHLENKIGNLRDTPLSELWNGETMQTWRRAQVEGRFSDSGPLCTRCNWRSAGAAPDSTVERWLDMIRDSGLKRRWLERKKR